MIKLYPRTRQIVGDVAAPHAVNDEIRAIVARGNALVAPQISGTIADSQVAPGAYGRGIVPVGTEVVQTISLSPETFIVPGDGLFGPTPRTTFVAVTDGAGDPWATGITTGDCVLELSWCCSVRHTWTPGWGENYVWSRAVVFVDGIPLFGPWSTFSTDGDSTPLCAHLVLPAGDHVVRPHVEIQAAIQDAATVELLDRSLLLFEKAR